MGHEHILTSLSTMRGIFPENMSAKSHFKVFSLVCNFPSRHCSWKWLTLLSYSGEMDPILKQDNLENWKG